MRWLIADAVLSYQSVPSLRVVKDHVFRLLRRMSLQQRLTKVSVQPKHDAPWLTQSVSAAPVSTAPSAQAQSARQAPAPEADGAAEEETEHRGTRKINANGGVTVVPLHPPHGLPLRPTVETGASSTGRPTVESIVSSKSHTVADEIVAKPPAQYLGREFTVLHINDSATIHSEKHYLVHWADSIMHKSLTRALDSGFIVNVDGEEWDAVSCTGIGRRKDCDELSELCYIQWKDTWVPQWQLDNARDAILEFEGLEMANAVLSHGEDVRSSIERPPLDQEPSPVPTARQERHDSLEADLTHDYQPDIPRLILRPEAGADYRPGLRELVARVIGAYSPMLKKWPGQNDKRHLLFSDSYIAKAFGFDMTRSERLNAAFAQISGVKQRRQCACCEKGNGPFVGCVVAANFAAGACANCAAGRNSRKCNFHVKCKTDASLHLSEANHWQRTKIAGHLRWNHRPRHRHRLPISQRQTPKTSLLHNALGARSLVVLALVLKILPESKMSCPHLLPRNRTSFSSLRAQLVRTQ